MGSVPRVGPPGWELVLGLCAGKERGVPWVRTCPGGAPGSIPALCPPHRECQQDAALWQTLRLDQRVSLDELLNISQVSAKEGHNTGGDMGLALCPAPPHGSPNPQYTEKISAAFQKLNITLTPISVLNESQRELLLNACHDAQPPGFTHTLQQVWGCGRDGGVWVLSQLRPAPWGWGAALLLSSPPPHLSTVSFPAGSWHHGGQPAGAGHRAGAVGGQRGEILSPGLRGVPWPRSPLCPRAGKGWQWGPSVIWWALLRASPAECRCAEGPEGRCC